MPRGKPFKPGQSGNPSGRPKKNREIERICREVLELPNGENLAAIRLREMIDDPETSTKDRKSCIELLMAYGYGKPRQRVEHASDPENPLQAQVVILPAKQ